MYVSYLSLLPDDKHGSSGDNSNAHDDIDNNVEDARETNDETNDKVPEMMKLTRTRARTRTISRSVYTDSQGNPVSQDVIADINQFQVCLPFFSLLINDTMTKRVSLMLFNVETSISSFPVK